MATTDQLPTATFSTDPGREMRTGGAILLMGALLFVATIGFEAGVGWPPPNDSVDIPAVILEQWPSLRWIWAVQGFACFFFALSALVLLRSRYLDAHWRPATPLWSAVAIGGIMVAVAFVLTIGSYGPALLALDESPEIFATVRGGVRFLYESGLAVVGLGHLVLFLREGTARDGLVPRPWLVGILVAIALAGLAVSVDLLRPSTVGAVIFCIPALLGLALWRGGRQIAPQRSSFEGLLSPETVERSRADRLTER